MESTKKFSGWKYLTILGIIYMFMMGFPQYGGPATAPYVLQAIPMDRALFGLGFTLFNLFVGLNSAFLAAPLIKRFGIRVTSVLGCLMLVVVAILMQFITNSIVYVVVFGVLTPVVLACGTMSSYATWVTRWFTSKRGRAMGILMTLASFGGFFAAPILVKSIIVANGNFRGAWVLMGFIGLICAILNWFIIKESPESVGEIPDGDVSVEVVKKNISPKIITQYEWTAKEAYKTISFWTLFVSGIAIYVPMFFFTAHFTLHGVTSGLSPEVAVLPISAFAISGVLGRFISGFLSERIEARYVISLGLLFSLIGAIISLNITGTFTAIIAGILFGAGFGWPYTAVLTAIANFYGIKAYPSILGRYQMLTSIFACPTGLIAGVIFDKNGSYAVMITAVIIICAVGVVCALLAKIPNHTHNLDASTM